ncbi:MULTISPECIES: extensin family protein [unclassified Afipia]|uniref:extensin-like domain-containing protein n=1 Tax=unclassified Afipia TaxID=2642050 RepID=UPI0004677F77|nr:MULTISPECIES: extensin family protein [unclassified Afipia]MAH68895.1 extensin [Afipia sp.]OUX61867.1 MAG: extensin [Afipia sp. TMED4]
MTRGVSWFVVGSLVLVALAGCGRGFMTAEREPWRAEAEKACLKSGAVKETADLVRIDPISGPGACGAEFPLKVAALGEPMSSLGYADDLRPPGSIGNQPRWPASQPQSPSYQPSYSSSQPPSYPSSSYPSQQPYPAARSPSYPEQAGAPMRLNAPGTEPPDEEDLAGAPDSASPTISRPQTRAPYAAQPYPPASQPYTPPRLGPSRGSPVNGFGAVAVKPAATLACPIVSALDRWLADAVQPAAQRWFGSPVAEIKQISAYSCRGMNGNSRAHISEHAFGNALDIAAFTLADGRRISVKDGWKGLPEEQGFLRDVQAAACQQFNTVLAPGSNVYHYDHIHVDLMRRASGRIICQPAAVSGEEIAARAAPRGYALRDGGVTGSIGQRVKRMFARGPLSKEDQESIEDESRIRER